LIEAIVANEARNEENARSYRADEEMYLIGGGPCFSTAYVFGVCIMMEMQWIHGHPIEAAEFFHGPFEIFEEKTPAIVLIGEDPTRPLAKRVERFCRQFSPRSLVYDSRDYALTCIVDEIRPIFSPLILQCSLTRLAARFATLHNHPLDTRRYMYKTEY
jgi:fructoselysine 6-phosphate deglycase